MYDSTLLIPTYNRSDILSKTLDLIECTFDLQRIEIIILDGSIVEEHIKRNKLNSKKIGIKYFHNSHLSLWNRIKKGIELSSTNIVSLLDDEDIINYDTYLKCVELIKNNNQYTVVHGEYKNFYLKDNVIYFENTYPNRTIENENYLNRLKEFMNPYNTPQFYAVFQKNIFRKIFYYIEKYNIPQEDYITTELLMGIISLLNGKSKGVDAFYIGRNRSNESFAPRFDFKKYILGFYTNVSYIRTVHVLKEVILEECRLLQLEYNEDIIEMVCSRWMKYEIDKAYSEEILVQAIEAQW